MPWLAAACAAAHRSREALEAPEAPPLEAAAPPLPLLDRVTCSPAIEVTWLASRHLSTRRPRTPTLALALTLALARALTLTLTLTLTLALTLTLTRCACYPHWSGAACERHVPFHCISDCTG